MSTTDLDPKMASHSNSDLQKQQPVYLFERLTCEAGLMDSVIAEVEGDLERREAASPALLPIGAWQSLFADESQICHLYAFENLGHLEAVQRQLAAANGSASHVISARRSAWLMSRLPYSPVHLAIDVARPSPDTDRVYWAIEVHCSKDSVANCIGIHDAGMERRGALHKSLLAAGGFKMLYGGRNNVLIHLYAYDSLSEMERLNKLLFSDTEFQKNVQPGPEDPPAIWEWTTRTSLLKPLPYSQMQ